MNQCRASNNSAQRAPSAREMDSSSAIHGFTLIELMITVAIIAILAIIAYPSYRQYALRAHRTEAKNMLQQAASREERFYATSSPNSYATTMSALGYSGANSQPTASDYYTVSVSSLKPASCSPTSTPCTDFTLTATPQNGQTSDPCGALTLNSAGQRDVPQAKNGETVDSCWN